ncbi:MAG: GcrA family cell cycle regulator [Alphaproteobacteria bacterium]
MSWTDERVTLLRELWAQGLSASQIAVQLGGVTRNAVIGKAHRLGLESRPSPIRGDGTGSRRRNRAIDRALEAKALRGTMADEEIGGEKVVPDGSTHRHERILPPIARRGGDVKSCLWPIGDPGDDDFGFCEADTVPGRPYCAKHCEVAYIRKDNKSAA